ncbi:MAG: chromosome condensation regulator, partial [Clostridia bacterium]
NVGSWRYILAISAGYNHTVGLKADGTVVAVGQRATAGKCDVGSWSNIIAISAGYDHTVGLKADGTIVVAGSNDGCQCDVGDWTNIMI